MHVRQWIELGLIYLLGVAASMGLGLLPPVAVDLRGAIHGSIQDVGLLLGALYIPSFVGSVFIGRLVDRLDSRILFVVGAVAMAVPAALNLMANSLVWWFADICLMGSGLVTLLVTAQTVLATTFRGKAQAGALSLWATAPYAGITCGLLLSGTLAETPVWRWVFLIQGLTALVLAVPVVLFLPTRRAVAPPLAAHGGGGFRVWVTEFKSVRLCLGYAVVTFCSAGSSAIWPMYLSRFHEMPLGTTTKLMALTSPFAILGALAVGVLNARAVSPAKIGLMLAGVAVLSTVVLYAPHIDLRLVAAAMSLWALCIGAVAAFTYSLIPRLLSDQGAMGVSTGMMYQLSSILAIGGVPAFFAMATLSQANLVIAGVIIASWAFMIAVTPMWRFANVGLAPSAPKAV